MALIKCPECGKEISDTVEQCPHCGYSLKKKKDKNTIVKVVIGVIAVFIVIFVARSVYDNAQQKKADQRAAELAALQASKEEEKAAQEAEEEAYRDKILDIYSNLVITDLDDFSNGEVKGTVTNNSDTTVYYVKVKITCLRTSGDTVDSYATYACSSEGLDPGDSCEFSTYSTYAASAGYKFTAEIYDFSIN